MQECEVNDYSIQFGDDRFGPRIEHYGIKIDKKDSNTSICISYLYDATNFTPAYMDYENGKFEPGSWSSAFFMRNNYPCMIKNDGTEDYKLDGTEFDVANLDYARNTFSCFNCHVWMRFYEDDNYCYVEVSNRKLDDNFVDYPYHRESGFIADKLYYPMYPGCIESWSYNVWFSILLILISKNYNVQAAFGNMSGGSSAALFMSLIRCLDFEKFMEGEDSYE